MQPVFRIVETISSVSRAVEQSTARLTNARFALLEHLALLAELHDGAFYVFYDRGQTIISRRVEGHTVQTAPQWIDAHMDCRLVLYRNCRNTAEIGRTVRSFLTGRQRNYLNEIHGKRPCAVFAPDIHALDTAAADFVQRMRSEEKLAIEDMVTFLKFLQKRNACRNVFLCGDISADFMFWRENLHFCKQ